MNSFDWTSTIKPDFLMLRIVGLWPQEKYKFDLYTLYTILTVNLLITSHVVFHTVEVFMVGLNLKYLIGALYMSLTETLVLIKICSFIINSKKLKALMVDLQDESFQPKSLEQIELVLPDLNFWKKVHRIFAFLVFNTVFLFISMPILSKSFQHHRLPLDAWYPYDTTKPPNYQITYLYQMVSILFRGTSSVGIDTFVAALNMYIETQCTILCDDLKKLDKVNFNQNLIKCVKHHQKIISFAKDCNEFYNAIVLGQFFTTSVALALALFLLSLVAPLSTESNTIAFYLGAATSEIFLYCWFGEEVHIKSSHIPYSAFESDWTEAPLEAKKNLLIFIMRSQKPIKMSAINLFSLSLATFTTILRTSWSYFAVLRQVNAQN